MNHSRRDLLELMHGLDSGVLHRRPRGGPRIIGNCLRHIAIAEWWYITRLDIELPTDFPRGRIGLLHYTRGLAERELKRLTKDQRKRIFQPRNDPPLSATYGRPERCSGGSSTTRGFTPPTLRRR